MLPAACRAVYELEGLSALSCFIEVRRCKLEPGLKAARFSKFDCFKRMYRCVQFETLFLSSRLLEFQSTLYSAFKPLVSHIDRHPPYLEDHTDEDEPYMCTLNGKAVQVDIRLTLG